MFLFISISLKNFFNTKSEIPINVIRTETEEVNQCQIITNTGRLHNEIVKQRLSCIPIHLTDLELLPDKYILEINMENTTDNIIYVTSENFRIKNKSNDNYLTKEQTSKIFPPDKYTNRFIDLVRLRPKIGDTIPGEKLVLTADFGISNSKENSMFNVASICSYAYTPDKVSINEKWEELREKYVNEGLTKEDVEFKKKNYYVLDAQRIFVENSFDFIIQTIGQYSNIELVKTACQILKNKFHHLLEQFHANAILITHSSTTMDNCFDVKLDGEDYTIGKCLEYILYDKYYLKEKTLTFCGFKKFHPHDDFSKIRIAFEKSMDMNEVSGILKNVANECEIIFSFIGDLF